MTMSTKVLGGGDFKYSFTPAISRLIRQFRLFGFVVLCLVMAGCSTAYYSALEKVGIHKRDVLVDRVEEVSEAQQEGQETFEDALTAFRSVLSVPPSELSDAYDTIKSAYDNSVDAAEAIKSRVAKVESVADALFDEWEDELNQYESKSLRDKSKKQLVQTRKRYAVMLSNMHKSRDRLDPVLRKMNDQVLYLKHNLNSQALGALSTEVKSIQSNVDALIKSMRQSISESQSFIKSLEG